ncbi:hypothetical protein SGRA_1864 [Saprospira grandis str. Lewin]|uniref:Uncharacterized protein n=2 Tax=Saprospira TaxID=1007 RepID=H6L0R2_SAPGL|nr:hypothetical protein SGRA_1864 [Saprospira grandis str. Lewin]
MYFWGCPCGLRPWVGLCRGSQVCSALRQQAGWVCGCAAPLSIPQPARCARPARPYFFLDQNDNIMKYLFIALFLFGSSAIFAQHQHKTAPIQEGDQLKVPPSSQLQQSNQALSRRSGQRNAKSNNQLLLGKRKPNDSQAAVRARLDGRPSPREERILAEERSKAQQAVTE